MSSRKIVKDRYFVEDERVETLAEVSEGDGNLETSDKLKIIGTSVPRIDGYDKVSGTAEYTYDKLLPRMAHAATLRCPHPHARIIQLDTAQAEAMKGVYAVITYKNTPKIPWYKKMTFLFDPVLRYAGDEVACVAAETREIALEALKQIKVEYRQLPFVIDKEKALKPDAPKLYEKGNVYNGFPFTYKRGDLNKGLEEADEIIEDTFSTQVAIHNPAEYHCSVANWEGNRLTIWDSTQAIYSVRDAVAESLNMPTGNVRVIKKYMGGGFGSKLSCGKYTVMAALLAQKIGRPVKIVLNRKEQNLAVGNRPDSKQTLKIGLKKDGTVTALSHHNIASSGAHEYGGGCSWPLRTMYRCENVKVKEYFMYVNAGNNRAYRAPGHVQGTFGLELLMDLAAEKIGMDPLELRMRNIAEKDQAFNLEYTSKRLKEAYEQGAEAFGWNRRQATGSSKGTMRRGMGMASQIWWGGGGPPAYATLKLNRDGSAIVQSGTQDIGTGTYTFVAMMVSEILEIPMENITVILGDTAVCPYGTLSGGSMTAPSISPAVYDAAVQMKNKLISGAAAALDLPVEQLIYVKGVISSKSDPDKKINMAHVIDKMKERVLITTGARNANPKKFAINTFGAQFAEVEVDTLSGRVKVLRMVAAHDIGRVLNWKTMENQMYGGITMGLSFALLEQRIMDESNGQVLNTNFHDYKIPTIMDIPDIKVIIVSDPDYRISSTGVKGVGEPAMIPTAAAIANAVYNAIGVPVKSLPMTPDKILTALTKAS